MRLAWEQIDVDLLLSKSVKNYIMWKIVDTAVNSQCNITLFEILKLQKTNRIENKQKYIHVSFYLGVIFNRGCCAVKDPSNVCPTKSSDFWEENELYKWHRIRCTGDLCNKGNYEHFLHLHSL